MIVKMIKISLYRYKMILKTMTMHYKTICKINNQWSFNSLIYKNYLKDNNWKYRYQTILNL